ncbi:mutS protein4-like, partial [Tropilaelaps mercedesae]
SLDPVEITVPRTALEARPEGQLIKQLKQFFPEVQLTGIDRRWYNDCKGAECLRKLNMFPQSVPRLDIELRNKYYALASASAIMKYVELVQKAAAPTARSLRIDILPPVEGICQLDAVTVRELELVASLDAASDAYKYTLFDVINYTATGPGQRALKLRLLQPLREVAHIEERLDCVAELINRAALAEDLRNLLSKTIDLERLIPNIMKARCANAFTDTYDDRSHKKIIHFTNSEHTSTNEICRLGEYEGLGGGDMATAMSTRVHCLLGLKHNLDILESFQTMLAPFANETLSVRGACSQQKVSYASALQRFMSDQRFKQISKIINDYLVTEVSFSRGVLDSLTARIGCIRTGISDTLDEYRKLYAQTVVEVENIRSKAAQEHQLGRLQLVFSAVRGFHFSLPSLNYSMSMLPPEFIKITQSRSNFHFTSEPLLRANERLNWVVNEIYRSSMVVLQPVIDQIRPHIESFFKLAIMWTELDVTCGLAILASVNDGFVRPRFDDHTTAIEGGRHPVLARYWSFDDPDVFHPNPVRLTTKDNMIVLTGPNNAGKSVYMKQLALLQILAQIGSFVPAKWAVFRPANSIFSRTGSGDDLVSSCSSYMLEVVRMSQVLESVEESSLVIVDELGRGTSEEDGAALCFSVASYLRKFQAFVVFSTHFELVTHLEKFYPNVSNCHIDAVIENEQLVYKRAVKDGVTPLASYGVQTARQNGVQDAMCVEAAEVAQTIWLNSKPLKELDEAEFMLTLRRQASALRKNANSYTQAGLEKLTREQVVELTGGIKLLEENRQNLKSKIATRQRPPPTIEMVATTRNGKNDSNVILQRSVTRPPISASPFFQTPGGLQAKSHKCPPRDA